MYGEESNLCSDNDAFKRKFKYYKSNKPKPSLREVISVDGPNVDKVTPIVIGSTTVEPRLELLGLQKPSTWKTYSLRDHPGLVFIRNPFTAVGQRYWIRQCLEVYPRKPNKLNIDIDVEIQDWWKECFEDGVCNRQMQKKLRWTTLGYHHNWDTKVYSDDNKAPFPPDLAELSDVVALQLGYKGFKAEAAIVNYYHMDSTLSAHTDHSEVNLDAPLFSFSFGQSAIFLIGGEEKTVEPSAVLIQSGDIIVMSKQARLCYHAVPKILPTFCTPWNDKENEEIKTNGINNLRYLSNHHDVISKMNKNMCPIEWQRYNSYVKESRINMNVRQVLNEKQNSLADSILMTQDGKICDI